MHQATIFVNPTLPDEIGFAQAAGMPGDVRFYFKQPNGTPYTDIVNLNPQLVLRPFTTASAYGYDILVNDVTGASGIATIPGSVMNDRFNIEVYTRNDQLQPQDMIACGRIDLTGYAYQQYGPLSPAVATVGPMGPAGPQGPRGVQGEQGLRGSRWYTGPSVPDATIPDVRMEGDMYLNESNGDVWRWDSLNGTWTSFKGVAA